MNSWVCLVCHPKQSKGSIDRQLQPPPPCDDLPSLLKNWIVKPIRAVVFADRDAFLWIQHKLGLSNYQMAVLAWVKGIVIGLLLGWWLF